MPITWTPYFSIAWFMSSKGSLVKASVSLYYRDYNLKPYCCKWVLYTTHSESSLERLIGRNSEISLKARHPQGSHVSQTKQPTVKLDTERDGSVFYMCHILKRSYFGHSLRSSKCFIGFCSLCLFCELLYQWSMWTVFRNRKTCTADINVSSFPACTLVIRISVVF